MSQLLHDLSLEVLVSYWVPVVKLINYERDSIEKYGKEEKLNFF
jgi:hypothetical protein